MKFLSSLALLVCSFRVDLHANAFTPEFLLGHSQKSRRSPLLYASSTAISDQEVLSILNAATVVNPRDGSQCAALEGLSLRNKMGSTVNSNKNNSTNNPFAFFINGMNNGGKSNKKTLVCVMPQLGEFDSAEYAELLASIKSDLDEANMALRVIGIGNEESARRFSSFAGLPLERIRVDPNGSLHRQLSLHGGPDWNVPSVIPDGLLKWFANYVRATTDAETKEDRNLVARAWLNYMAMCAGIAAPDTLPEIIRGYLGDKTAPERLRPDETVRVGEDFIAVTGVTDVKLGPISYQSLWKNEQGYQRPVELATVRLRVMVEVLTNFKSYVPDQKHLHLRGATFLFDEDGNIEYEHRDTGVLAYSKTMARPLTFLRPYIGDKALNPLGLGDNFLD